MAINLTTKYSEKIAERFSLKSITDAYAGKDFEFTGVKSVKIYSVDTVPIVDYTRSGTSRFGTLNELGDTVQEISMTQDKGFNFSIDAGNAAEQLNIKRVSQCLKRNWDERATPLIDKYRFEKWISGCGLVAAAPSALTKSNIIENIMLGSSAMNNALVPSGSRTLFVRESLSINAKLSTEIIGLEKLGIEAVSRGHIGKLDGMPVICVPDVYFPAGVNFFIKYKNSTVDPMKLKTMRVHKNPMGIDGDVGECRFMFDDFIKGTQVNGLYVNVAAANVVANPVIAISANSATITCGTSGAVIKYTLNGTDPKTSSEALTYSAAVPLASGQTIRCFASKAELLNSGVIDAKN
ncbi:MAG: chitobiase/beta-hexosaminidase C-terminal domain-containing protein [Oscillospiraceae bacterium]